MFTMFRTLPMMFGSDSGGGTGSGGESKDGTEHANSGGQQEGGSGEQKGEQGGGSEKTYTEADVTRLVKERFDRERKSIRAEVEESIREEAAAAEAKKQGDFKTLYEKAQDELDKLKAAQEERDRIDLRKRIAREVGLPEDAHVRLVGETEAELKTDAKALKKQLAPEKTDLDTDAGKTRNERNQTNKDEDKKKYSDPKFWGLPTG